MNCFGGCCFSSAAASSALSPARSPATISPPATPTPTIKNRLSSTLTDIFRPPAHHQHHRRHQEQPQEDQDSLIDAAATNSLPPSSPQPSLRLRPHQPHPHRHRHNHRSTIVGTIYGRRRGHVRLCFQSDSSVPPPFLFHLSVPTHYLAQEMNSGLLRVALECHRRDPRSSAPKQQQPVWRAYCNGLRVGYAVRRKPSETDKEILNLVRTMSAGAGVLSFSGYNNNYNNGGGARGEEADVEEGELLYMRASYERVVGSRDSVSYHLINPDANGGSPAQELSVFLLRTTG